MAGSHFCVLSYYLVGGSLSAWPSAAKWDPRQFHEQRHGGGDPLVLVMGAHGGDPFPGKVAVHRLQRALRQLPLHGKPGQQGDTQITGIRSNYGLLRGTIAASSGVDYAGVSFVLAAAQLAFGIMQTVFGAAALKTSSVSVLLCGAAMALLGLALTPLCRGLLALLLCFGILMPAGLGAFSFGLIMGAVTPLLGEKRAAVSGWLGSFVSAWIGGLAVAATGGYTLIWCINAALCLLAAACAFRVRIPAAGVEA